MSEMDRNSDPSQDDLFTAGIEKMRNAEDKGVPTPPPAPSDTPSRVPRQPDMSIFKMGGTLRHGSRGAPHADSLDDVRRAIRAAADAIIQPWLYTQFPRIIEQRLSTALKDRVEQMAAAVKDDVTDEVNQRLGAALKQAVVTIEKGLATTVTRQMADTLNQRLEPAVHKHVAAIEERLVNALNQRVTDAIDQRLERAVSKDLTAIEERIAIALNKQVIEAVNQHLEPAATKHAAAVEERIVATASRQVKDEISRRLRRFADDG
jgi:uncharacterized membrane protein YheB (UPF0754 family)